MWLDMSVASISTRRCLEAGANAWHVLMRTEEDTDENTIAAAIMSSASNEKDCVASDDSPRENKASSQALP